LVYRSVTFFQKVVGKVIGDVINTFCLLISYQIAIVALCGKKGVSMIGNGLFVMVSQLGLLGLLA